MTESDASLVARVQRGETKSADVLLRRHFRSCYLVALARARNPSDAEDICQDAFIKCLEQIHACRNPERFGAWLLQIVRNTAHNRMEYLLVRECEPITSDLELVSHHQADTILQQRELRATLLNALAQLNLQQREVVLLHDLEGLSHGEIAAQLEVSVFMSRRHLSDARKKLRDILGNYMTLEPDHD
ncbi:MAG: RNA polymerase sigma factor [Gemmatimonadota bacterium]|nr:RNA polymerase sigma factor [Gemmatimonadota bacterium]